MANDQMVSDSMVNGSTNGSRRDGEIRIGARRSPLARAQADQVAAGLTALGLRCHYVPIITHGDTDRRELTQIGGTGVFTSSVRDALLAGEIDVGVHSLKDLPTEPAAGLRIAALLEREDTRDVLVGFELDRLLDRTDAPSSHEGGWTIGTGAPRRAVQLLDLARRHGIGVEVRPVRGNVGTRLGLVRSGQLDAVVLAAAGLRRLGLLEGTGERVQADGLAGSLLGPQVMLPAAGQGAIACEVADSLDSHLAEAVTRLDHGVTRAEVLAERTFLNVLEAGCTAPVGARAVVKSVRDTSTDLTLTAVIGKTVGNKLAAPPEGHSPTRPTPEQLDPAVLGSDVIRVQGRGSSVDPEDVGRRLAQVVLSQGVQA